MPNTTWTNEVSPGQSQIYNAEDMTYSQSTNYQGAGTPRYNKVGETTSWTLEDK